MQADIGLNSIAHVKLTPFGQQVLDEHYAHVNAQMKKIHPFAPTVQLTERERAGEFLLWRIEAIFGPHLDVGSDRVFEEGVAVEL